ncbi:anti-phage protein KwaA [Chryseobacterium sp. CT-SW4]|uniref:anti-phage protein KwaA n=1 Tax=Chryseobacterium sp. SW-1 TaxID=3157343 RepID=UPI003B0223DD
MYRKIGLFFLSLWLLFLMVIIITIDVPFYLKKDFEFVGFKYLIINNIIPLFCLLALITGLISYLDFNYQVKGTPQLSFKISKIENIDYEHLTFLTTYIIPLVCFQFENIRYLVVFTLILFIISIIYIRTDLFYANPTLAILQFRIYKVDGEFRNGEFRNSKILITKDKLTIDDRVKYFRLDERIYYAFKITSDE